MNKTKKFKIVTIVGTRPEIIRLSSIIDRLNKSKYIDHSLIHTGQNYDHNLNEIFFKDLEIREIRLFFSFKCSHNQPMYRSVFLKSIIFD